MERINTWYKNSSFRKKVMILCLTVSLIPTLVLGGFCMVQCRRLLYRQEEFFMHTTVQQANQSLDHFLSLHTNIIKSMVWDEDIRRAVNKEYTGNYERFLANHEVFNVRIPLVTSMNEEILRATIYTGTNLYAYGTLVAPLEEIGSETWYQRALTAYTPFLVREEGTGNILLICAIPDSIYQNVVVITLSGERIFEIYNSLFEYDYAVGIYDQNGELFYNYSELESAEEKKISFCRELEELRRQADRDTFAVWENSDNAFGWTTIVFRPHQEILASVRSILWIIAGMVLLCISAVYFIGGRLSRHVVTPLEQLTKNMDRIEADDFSVTVTSKYNDEIAHLIRAFQSMADRLQKTINELYVSRIMKQEYRLQMLQSQINPHFLYNCLSMINGKAIRSEQPEIGRIALLLSTFYRTTLNKGHSKTTVQQEWKNVMAYVELQKILHANSFEVDCHMEEELMEYQIITLVIQPLVENAILHGIDYREDETEPGKVYIRGEIAEQEMRITVSDNGCGMDEATCRNILTEETKGYGIMNVNQRIKLYFGEKYGITYKSIPGKGTDAVINLPLWKEEKTQKK